METDGQSTISKYFDFKVKSKKTLERLQNKADDPSQPEMDDNGAYRTRIKRNGKVVWARVKRCTLCGEEVRLASVSSTSLSCYEQHLGSPRCHQNAIKLMRSATADEQGVYLVPEDRGGRVVFFRYKQCVFCQKHIGLGMGTKFTAFETHLKSEQCFLPAGSRVEVSSEGRLSIFFSDGSQLSHPYVEKKLACKTLSDLTPVHATDENKQESR
ncbi:hypothetical protein SCHPADRAFT_324438 [Schizopora paradoxa]|uniref:Uncharacterized protein n=1 Tax=Schizopora paradoxa TaxID=27342 RepID=A0A0H2RQM9_9AGAM|nr:hypothetical protein SCHPADRAFT_324438 [Schizopora paradoxa]